MTIRLRFAKYGVVKFIGHLDVVRYFQKAVRRAGIDVKYSEGFHPHQMMTFTPPIGVGITSDAEYLELELSHPLEDRIDDPDVRTKIEGELFEKLSAAVSEGIAVLDVRALPKKLPNVHRPDAMTLTKAADYKVSVKDGYDVGRGFSIEDVQSFLARSTIVVTKKSKKLTREVDLKPYIHAITSDRQIFCEKGAVCAFRARNEEHADVYENGKVLYMRLAAGNEMNVRPELVLEAMAAHFGISYDEAAYQIHRMEIYGEDFVPIGEIGLQ